MEDILENSNLSVEVIEIADLSFSSGNISVKLMEIWNDTSGFMCKGETTHTLVMYDSGMIVSGALLLVTDKCVIIKRVCITNITPPEHTLKILRCLQRIYSTTELHLSILEGEIRLYSEINFVRRHRKNCDCKHSKHMEHIVWSNIPKDIIIPRKSKGSKS
jgi:hypothetical protein